jgi:acetyl-CoA acetyltransferase
VPDQSYDGFVAKYSAAGQHVRSKQLHADYLARVNAVTTNAAGDIALAGYFDVAAGVAIGPADALLVTGTFNGSASTPANFGGAPFSGAGAADAFVAKYSASRAHVWSSPHGGAGADTANAVAVDTSGVPFVQRTRQPER